MDKLGSGRTHNDYCKLIRYYVSLQLFLQPFTTTLYLLIGMKQPATPTVWIVDDDEDDQLFIRSAFMSGQPPIDVLLLSDGDQLLPKLNESAQLPRLILLDVNMPRQNGFETLKELRSTPGFAKLPVVMLTTSSAEDDHKRSLALGANKFLTKPLSIDQLKKLAQELSREWELG